MAGQRFCRCVNCDEEVPVRAGLAVAWFWHCRPCADLVADQLEPLDLPCRGRVVIYRCRRCGVERVCHPRWRTRCHVCLNDRSSGFALAAGERLLVHLATDALLAQRVRQFALLPATSSITTQAAAEYCASAALASELDRFRRPGWTVVAGDVHGLPWLGARGGSSSHGTWGYHDACQTWQKLTLGPLDCLVCGPRPGSRRHDVRKDDPYLLYLMRHRGLQKFGVGDERRVLAHLARGAHLLQVLEARHAEVIEAEMVLKRQKRAAAKRIWGWRMRRMPVTFGVGTEVVPAKVSIDLTDVLPNGRDVTERFTYRPQ